MFGSGLLNAEAVALVPLQELARRCLEPPSTRQVSARNLEEPREEIRGPLAADPPFLDHRDRVWPLREVQTADVVVVLDLEGPGADHLALGRVTPATTIATTAGPGPLHEEGLPGVLDEAGPPHAHPPTVREVAVEVLEERREEAGGALAAQLVLVGHRDGVAALAKRELADVVVVQNAERIRAPGSRRGAVGVGEDRERERDQCKRGDGHATRLDCGGRHPLLLRSWTMKSGRPRGPNRGGRLTARRAVSLTRAWSSCSPS